MADSTGAGPSIQSMVDKAVSAQLKKGKGKTPTVRGINAALQHRTNLLLVGEEEPFHEFFEAVCDPRGQGLRAKAVAQAPVHRQGRQQEARGIRFRQAEAEERQEAEEALNSMSAALFPAFTRDVNRASSLPDWLLTIPPRIAVDIVVLNTSFDYVLAAQFKNYVHTSTGVNLPKEISYQLSVGMRYLYFSPRNSNLIMTSYNDFVRRLRWRLKFAFEQGESPYDPDYDVRKPSIEDPPHLPLYLELGFKKGIRFVRNAIANVPLEDTTETKKPFAPSVKQIKEFLFSNGYVITGTDKNLGIAVSERTWVIERSLAILENKDDYEEITRTRADSISRKKCTEMNALAELAAVYLLEDSIQLEDFLRSKVTPVGGTHKYPAFYGIPKIHKQPTKFRPIIPCHSAMQNPAAKYVSKKLKPLILAAPTIIHGTKDLAIKLSKLEIPSNRRFFIVTGDVVAFYPNVPLTHALDIIFQQYMEHYWANDAEHDSPRAKKIQEIFKRMLIVGNTELITTFQDKLYLQLRGLAMGVADSPDIANLYGWEFEKRCNVLNDPRIPFYGRYIDDCLALVYASSESEAVHIMSEKISYDGCEIEWSASEQFQPFLDMLIYKDERNTLQHMPYRKAQNHQERIPWISHHPLDVKRGTFYGEMSRLATLSSTREAYENAMKGLVTLYIVRGYPEALVRSWLKNKIKERWEKRLNIVPKDHVDVLVLKTEFNTAWNYFSASELGETVLGYWREYADRIDRRDFNMEFPVPDDVVPHDISPLAGVSWQMTSHTGKPFELPDVRKINVLDRKVITSRKRTKNLFDLASLWKKTVLEELDEKVCNEFTDLSQPTIQNDLEDYTVSYAADNDVHLQTDEDGNTILHRRSSSPISKGWREARM
jgi:hypothetical protein